MRRDRCWRPSRKAMHCAPSSLHFAGYCAGCRLIRSGRGSESPSSWSSPTGIRCNLNHVQPLGNPETKDCEEQNAPSYCNYFQVTAQRTCFVANRVLSPYEVCLCGIEDEVILLFHIEHSAIQKHHHGEGCQGRFQNNQTHKGSTHVNLQRWDLGYWTVAILALQLLNCYRKTVVAGAEYNITGIGFNIETTNCDHICSGRTANRDQSGLSIQTAVGSF